MVSGGVQNCAFAHLKVSVAGQCHAFAYLKASVAVSPQAHHYSIAVLCMIWNVLDHQNMQHKGGGGLLISITVPVTCRLAACLLHQDHQSAPKGAMTNV